MAEIDKKMLILKNGENLAKNHEDKNYSCKDGKINLEDSLIDNKKRNQEPREIEKMWESMLRVHDEIETKTGGKEVLEIIEDKPEKVESNVEINPEDEELDLDLSEELPPEVMEYAKRELGETEEVKCQTLQELRDMIYEKGECSPHRMDDAFLIRFLRARNFNVYRAHRLIVKYCNFKEEYPEIHKNVNPLEMRHIGDDDVMTVPAYRTQCGRRMMIYRMGNWDPKKYGVEEIFKATVIILELGILEPRAQVLGGVVIFDLQGITIAHAWSVTPQIANMVLGLMVTANPMKTYAIHILHQSWVFDMIYAVFKPLLNKEMQDRVFFHGDDMSSLHKHVAPTSLPKKYGGTREELPYYKWIDSLSLKPRLVKEMYSLGYIVPDELLETIKGL
ncbi:alpha-tocopherol transfer protein-like [Chelonus insularis]|uniref:alpha-tocopherol transfer protein-like n=1 Tax=Chelonus insularis TaxID=460826 RepID=UPI00158F0A04|nr:alpha-tocopherol transfer protein-like [Chelonus insularis]XP_034941873.1 alpha-tocopherol transfer protein-like [Chelonus insularis]XP_034941874.1 alpha-tocopherol transfer protein-like [Chelonus insularis]XP_034941875.1 alpha-tocopherol transfer protein-like [Chelonus insularis]XP_034941876.1 alpha-tocopherol transfer protein-like [Chelonus insularis]